MRISILADDHQKAELERRKNKDVELVFASSIGDFVEVKNADAYFMLVELDLDAEELATIDNKPIFINSVSHTLSELGVPANFHRINGWRTFLGRDICEVATCDDAAVKDVLRAMQWKCIKVKDTPGMVAARPVAMIINEAYFALGEQVSTKEEIDTAMKLGTNYPHGPFEWAQLIGLENIGNLLEKLALTDSRYAVADRLTEELKSVAP